MTLADFCTAAHDISMFTCCHMHNECRAVYRRETVLWWSRSVQAQTPCSILASAVPGFVLAKYCQQYKEPLGHGSTHLDIALAGSVSWASVPPITARYGLVCLHDGDLLHFTFHALNTGFSVAVDGQGAQGRVLCIADSLLVLIVMPFVYMPLIMSNKETLARDAPAKLYNNTVYYCAITLANMPATVLTALAFVWPVYSLAGFRHSVPALAQASCMYALQHLCSTQASSQGLKPQDYSSLMILSAGSVVIVRVFRQSSYASCLLTLMGRASVLRQLLWYADSAARSLPFPQSRSGHSWCHCIHGVGVPVGGSL